MDTLEKTEDEVNAIPECREVEGSWATSGGDDIWEEARVGGRVWSGNSIIILELGAEDITIVTGFLFAA